MGPAPSPAHYNQHLANAVTPYQSSHKAHYMQIANRVYTQLAKEDLLEVEHFLEKHCANEWIWHWWCNK